MGGLRLPADGLRDDRRPPRQQAPYRDRDLRALSCSKTSTGFGGLRKWKLELDGEVIASIENGGISVLDAQPGRHCLRVFYDSYSSPALELELRRGRELVLGCRQQESPVVNLFSPKRSLVLELLANQRLT